MTSAASRIVAVTGGARGIGRNIAKAFALEGARVYLCDRDTKQSAVTAREFVELGWDAKVLDVDLSLRGGPEEMVAAIANIEGRLDVLVNNAQSTTRMSFLDETEDSWDTGLSVILRAAFFAARKAVRVMEKHRGGSIINIASVAGFQTTHDSPSYHVAKAGIIQMTRYLSAEAGRYGVRVNAICPGFIVQDEHRERFSSADNMHYRELANYCHPLGAVGKSNDVAALAVFLCSEGAAFINGQAVIVDGGMTHQSQFCLLNDYSKTRAHK